MKNLKILIAEDEAIVAMNLKIQLSKFSMDVLPPVARGEKAVSLARTERPDVVIMDIGLTSSMTGIEAAREILSFHKPLLIFTSGYVDDVISRQVKELNATIFYKPFEVKRIARLINEQLVKQKGL